MPQMAPMWWTLIMLLTLIFMLIMLMINYFSFIKKLTTKSMIFSKKMIWKW
uniref:ATP synthase F0 subunit 8 n=1 Tax=Hishimonus phycitis TaxID=706848 RepID=A0A343K628_9HEMI|nr:ATP synthase F0 subunit 8 [Hishimonus phycitis]